MRYKFTFEFDTTRELSKNEARQLCLNVHSDIKKQMEYIPLPFINTNVKTGVEEVKAD